MVLPKEYMKLSHSERLDLMTKVKDGFKTLDRYSYPTIYKNLQNDETKYAIIERIINEIYANDFHPNLKQVFSTMEIILSD